MSGTRARFQQNRDASCHQVSFFLQGKAPKEIHSFLTETLACFLPGRAKDLPVPLYFIEYCSHTDFLNELSSWLLRDLFELPFFFFVWNRKDQKTCVCVSSIFSGVKRVPWPKQHGKFCFKERRGNWQLHKEAPDRILCRIRFVRGYGPIERHTAKWMHNLGSIQDLTEIFSLISKVIEEQQ